MKFILSFLTLSILTFGCKDNSTSQENLKKDTSKIQNTKTNHQLKKIKKATIPPEIDGIATDSVWKVVEWQPVSERWIGQTYSPDDFEGKFKLSWTSNAIYILAEIKDDILYDKESDPLTLWWDDDCLEIFIDADNSGGEHQFNHNAFAYHVALDGNVVDIAPGSVPTLYNNHVKSKRLTNGNITIWECEMTIYDNTYTDGEENTSIKLIKGQLLGFALAYCDNDSSVERENFIGSVAIPGEDKNRGWIDAGVFGTIELVE